MNQIIYLYCYCREYMGTVELIRSYKYQAPKKDTTPSCSMLLFSEKSKRYHETYIYLMDWKGNAISLVPDSKLFRASITRIGLDVR